MADNAAVPFWDEGNTLTASASAAVTGKRFVKVSGPRVGEQVRVAHADAGSNALGVSGFDAPVDGLVTVYSAPGLVMPVTTSAAVSAGDDVEITAGGKCAPVAAGVAVGMALDDAANGADALVKLY